MIKKLKLENKLFIITLSMMIITWWSDLMRFDILAIITSFKYFTIISNGLVVMYFALWNKPWIDKYKTSITTAIFITFAVYNALLLPMVDFSSRGIYDWMSDLAVHVINPLILILYYIFYNDKKENMSSVAYVVVMAAGYQIAYAVSYLFGNRWFPYFFNDIGELGVLMTIVWTVILAILFMLSGLGLVLLTNKFSKRSN